MAKQLSDLNTWDGVVERHKESKDWAQPEKEREREEKKVRNKKNHLKSILNLTDSVAYDVSMTYDQ